MDATQTRSTQPPGTHGPFAQDELRIHAAAKHPEEVDAAITSRISARAFLPRPVPRAVVQELLAVASRAPSGGNTRPWNVYVLEGESRAALVQKVCAAHDAVHADPSLADAHRQQELGPPRWVSPFRERRRENGLSLYALLGIAKGDTLAMHRQHQANYRFFDAPVGLLFTMHRELGMGSLLDCGMFMQNIMTAARARGLHTCPQGAWNRFANIVLPLVGAGADELLVCGMALGHADPDAAVNRLRTPREEPHEFARWPRIAASHLPD